MTSNHISSLVQEIRKELNLTRGVSSQIENVYEHDDNSLHLVASDRAEKSLLLGPGGRVTAELAKRTERKITIYGADEILLRRHRLRLTMFRIEEIMHELTDTQSTVVNCLRHLIEQELSYPESQIQRNPSFGKNLKIALAFSGGIDSTASGIILKESGFIVDTVLVDMGHQFQNPKDIKLAEDWCLQHNIGLTRIDLAGANTDLLKRVDAGRIHPCGECHSIVMERVKEYITKTNYEVLVTGELLPSGRQSILFDEGLLIIHLPAALSLSKHRTETIAEKSGKKLFRRKFGCNLVGKSHSKGWKNVGPSIFRVLRELEAGVLTTGQSLEYIKDIVRE
jgi:predicted PP-loop superfamily ATPase